MKDPPRGDASSVADLAVVAHALAARATDLVSGTTAAVLGDELTTNGGFTGSAAGWTLGGGATYGTDNITMPDGGTAEQTITVTAGEVYQIEVTGSIDYDAIIELGSVSSGAFPYFNLVTSAGLRAAESGPVVLRVTFVAGGTLDAVTAKHVVPSGGRTIAGVAMRSVDALRSFGLGPDAQEPLTSGARNVGIGHEAQRDLTTGYDNVGIGDECQETLSTGWTNVGVGSKAQQKLTTGAANVAVGVSAQQELTTGYTNVSIGNGALLSVTTGFSNTALGTSALRSLATAWGNTTAGRNAGRNVSTGVENTVVGFDAAYAAVNSVDNATTTAGAQTIVGCQAGLASAVQHEGIVAVGWRAGAAGTRAIAVGYLAAALHDNAVALGDSVTTQRAASLCVGERDIEIMGSSTKGLIMRSPDGTAYRLRIANGGTVTIGTV